MVDVKKTDERLAAFFGLLDKWRRAEGAASVSITSWVEPKEGSRVPAVRLCRINNQGMRGEVWRLGAGDRLHLIIRGLNVNFSPSGPLRFLGQPSGS